MIVGYACTSTPDQVNDLEIQKEELSKSRAEKLFYEFTSAKNSKRPQLKAALEFLREGDVFVVTRPDRLCSLNKRPSRHY
ncbi:recombinase family protein [Entomobacter blattae]|uniref:Tn552 family DNA-invertase protein n=1 Tax=Entomobacter blattae TaxID=2762277 RepID=A0A7H1NRJ4_9PROT|nr:Putative Tn552 family DNA-invertase protein [Entomobacter blattae]